MRHWLIATATGVFLVSCGGADTTIGDGGEDSPVGNDTGTGDDTGTGTDAGDSGQTCMMGQTSCNGSCVNTSTDPANCGGCGVNCTGGTCANGICQLLNLDGGMPPAVGDFACVAVDQQYVYVATGVINGMVYKVPVNGGTWSPVATMQGRPHGIKSNGPFVYWTNFLTGEVMRANPNGMNLQTLAMNQNQPFFVTLDNTYVFWINSGTGAVQRANLDGSMPMQLFAGYGANHAGQITNSGANVYFASYGNGIVATVPKAGGSVTPLAMNQQGPFSCDADGTSLFWGNAQGGQIQKVALQNPQTPTAIAQNQTSPHGVSTDGKNVYWSNSAMAGTINKTTTNGGNVTQLAGNQTFPDCTAVDATSVYWINLGGGMISKTAK